MKKRSIGLAAWLILAGLLYFFENNTGTRIVLACSWLLPFVPALRRSLWEKDAASEQPKAIPHTIQSFANREEDDPGDVRSYLPGDPVNRVHWKLSAKRDELLVREQAKDKTAEEEEQKAVFQDETPPAEGPGKRIILMGLSLFLFSLILLFAIPSANQGMRALLNRLYDASEAVNAYAYRRFDVPAGSPIAFAAVLLAVMAVSLIGVTVLSGSRLLAGCLLAGCVVFQVYFGLSFPAWVNVPLFALIALWMLKRPWNRKTVLSALAGIVALSLAVLLIAPGVDTAVEAASEAVRDQLSRMAQQITGAAQETPAGETETRHVHTQSLTEGGGEARPNREYRLVTVEEERVSMPHWVNYLRILLLLLLAAAVVILPFLPFMVLNRRRKRALDARQAFESENVSEAIAALFQHVTAWLEATGNGGGNAPYMAWRADLSPDYAERFAACEKLFEEATYSTHAMREDQRQQVLALLHETEQVLQGQADWKQKLRLKYRECLWV